MFSFKLTNRPRKRRKYQKPTVAEAMEVRLLLTGIACDDTALYLVDDATTAPMDDTTVGDTTIANDPFLEALIAAVDAARLDEVAAQGIYTPDTLDTGDLEDNPFDDTWVPGFDCDDFATAEINFCEHTLAAEFPDADFDLLAVTNADDGDDWGHAVVLVENDGYIYIVDPQTGAVSAGMDKFDEVYEFIGEVLDEYPNAPDDFEIGVFEQPLSGQPGYAGVEPPSFESSAEMVDLLECILCSIGHEDPELFLTNPVGFPNSADVQ